MTHLSGPYLRWLAFFAVVCLVGGVLDRCGWIEIGGWND